MCCDVYFSLIKLRLCIFVDYVLLCVVMFIIGLINCGCYVIILWVCIIVLFFTIM